MQFDLALAADRILQRLEEERDRHVPKTPDETWDSAFCAAVEAIPDARRFVEECVMNCTKVR